MSLLQVADALERLLASVLEPTPVEMGGLHEGLGRVLAHDLAALRTQPPFPASAMDGYAVRAADLAAGASLRVIGESAAGRGFRGIVKTGEAVRIFTGAPVPEAADTILMQENADGVGSALITARQTEPLGRFVRKAGLDFAEGDVLLRAGTILRPAMLGLAAAMGHATLPLRARPRVAILATGDELVQPGEAAGPDQIIASNTFALAALVRDAGGEPLDLGIAADTMAALATSFAQAKALKADILVTLGGASVGDHDLVQAALKAEGMDLGFWKVAMRPGKPLMHGKLGRMIVLGLPGNPVSSIVCGHVFLKPLMHKQLGLDVVAPSPTIKAILGCDLPANDERADYMRAKLSQTDEGLVALPFPRQDSSMLATLARADALLLREPHAPSARAGDHCRVMLLS
jgi:molybdopterin molybdotransferase